MRACVHTFPRARVNTTTPIWNIFPGAAQQRYDYTRISAVATEDTKQCSLHFTCRSRRLLPLTEKHGAGAFVALQLGDKRSAIFSIWQLMRGGRGRDAALTGDLSGHAHVNNHRNFSPPSLTLLLAVPMFSDSHLSL